MGELPRALVPWAEHLDLFPHELALSLGPLVARLDAVIGTVHHAPDAGTTDPDGFDGLARRGSYERLLLSEWLLAEEAPDEFLRRAAGGEHAFHRLAHRDPAAGRQCVVLFDAGPNQLGSPRLVHLAALIVLARRAHSSGARFAWGVLQKPALLRETINAATIRAWLGERGVTEATENHAFDWQGDLEERTLSAKSTGSEMDLWIIGGHRLQDLTGISSTRLLVRDVLKPDVRQVRIELQQKGAVLRHAVLDLPQESACARLLRDPFGKATAEVRPAPGGLAPSSSLVWAAGGGKIFARTEGGALIVWSVPNSAVETRSKPKIYRPRSSGAIIAAGRVRKTVVIAVLSDPTTLVIESFGKNSASMPNGEYQLQTAISGEDEFTLLPCLLPKDSPWMRICLPGQRLVRIHCDTEKGKHQLFMEAPKGAVAAAQADNRLIYLPASGTESGIVAVSASGEAGERTVHPLPGIPRQAFEGYSSDGGRSVFGLWAVEIDEGRWQIVSQKADEILVAPSTTRVIGVIFLQARWDTPGLVVIEEDGRTISLMGRRWAHSLPPASGRILHACVSPSAPSIAYSTVDGEVAVYSLPHNAYFMRFQTGETT
jgi:hypothetical protein